MPLGKHGGFAIALTWGTGHGARGDCDLRQVSTFVGKAIGRLNQPAPRIIVGRAHGGMVDNAWMTAMQHTKIMRRSEEHTSELQSLMRTSYAVFCLKQKIKSHKLVVLINV